MSGTEVLLYEEHCSVLADWHARRYQGQTLVYLDAHLDLQHISETRLSKLANAANIDAFKALEKPSHFIPDNDYIYGLENFLYPAFKLGIISQLVWVAPPHVPVELSIQVLSFVQQMDGVQFEELTSFKQTPNGWYEGKLLGLPITVCRLEQLKDLSLPDHYLIDIDTDYFVSLPEDKAWIDPQSVFDTLSAIDGNSAMVSISRSVSSGFMPFQYHYFADYLKSLWEKETTLSDHYLRLFNSENYPTINAYDPLRHAGEIVNRFLDISPDDIQALDSGLRQSSTGRAAMGMVYVKLGRIQEAITCYQEYGKPHPQLALSIAQQLRNSDAYSLREDLLKTALLEDSSATLSHLLLAEIYYSQKNYTLAEHHLLEVMNRAPSWLEPLEKLAILERAKQTQNNNNLYQATLRQRKIKLQEVLSGNGFT